MKQIIVFLMIIYNIRIEIDTDHLKSVKSIIKPAITSIVLVHTVKAVLQGYHKQYIVSIDLGTKNHYRYPNQCINKHTITDNVIQPFKDKLRNNVKKLKHSIFTV